MTSTATPSWLPDEQPTPDPPRTTAGTERRTLGLLRQTRSLVTFLRWATLAVGFVIGFLDSDASQAQVLSAGTLLGAMAVWRTVRPARPGNPGETIALLLDVAIAAIAVLISSGWGSPFVLASVPSVLVAGQHGGYLPAFCAASAIAASGAFDAILDPQTTEARDGAQVTLLLLVSAALAGFIHSLARSAEEEHRLAADETARMRNANELLLALHDVAQTLPSSLDLGEVMASTKVRLRELFDFDSVTILVRDQTSSNWRVELADGVRLPATIGDNELATVCRSSLSAPGAVVVHDLLAVSLTGCSALSRSAVIAPLRARGAVVGLVSIESIRPDQFGDRDAALLDELTEPVALAVDNAMWFGRLRTLGAEAERSRIARDLHDRTAQSLAYIAFELERIEASRDGGDPEIAALRDTVRGVVGELRETLYQLRAEIDEDNDLQAAAEIYVPRWAERTGVQASFAADTQGLRLPVQVEQELWRILQESLNNVAKHAQANRVDIRWRIGGGVAQLEIRDDGKGFRATRVGKERFGLVGMRERADAIGAHLTVDAEPGAGTRVLVEIEVPM